MVVTRRSSVGIAVGLVLISSCVTISSKASERKTQVSSRTEVEVVPDSHAYAATLRLEGETMLVELRREQRCRTITFPRYRKHMHTEREPAPGFFGFTFKPSTTYYPGGLAAGFAFASLIENESASDRRNAMIFGGIGAALLTTSLVDWYRLRDEDSYVGESEERGGAEESACRPEPAPNRETVVTIDGTTWREVVETDDKGQARVSLSDLPYRAFKDSKHKVVLFQASVGGSVLAMELPSSDGETLFSSLAMKPDSQLRRDMCVTLTAEAAQVQVTESTLDAEALEMESRWVAARAICHPHWTPASARAEAAFKARLRGTAKARTATQCKADVDAVVQLLSTSASGPALEMSSLQASFEQKCKDLPDAAKMRAALQRAAFDNMDARLRQNHLLIASELLEKNYANLDALGVALALQNADLVTRMKERHEATLEKTVSLLAHWATRLRASDSAEVRDQLCAASQLIEQFATPTEQVEIRAIMFDNTPQKHKRRLEAALMECR